MVKPRQILLTISIEIDDANNDENLDSFVDELDYNISSNTSGITIVNTEIVDYEEIETCRIINKETK